ncbi:hypothetical protein FOA52_014887 [Chlamydomonas sp. UWO 241]|nr:hypothetical protein FOA52_014887 [Chlamydomonas sp. UWO 241]
MSVAPRLLIRQAGSLPARPVASVMAHGAVPRAAHLSSRGRKLNWHHNQQSNRAMRDNQAMQEEKHAREQATTAAAAPASMRHSAQGMAPAPCPERSCCSGILQQLKLLKLQAAAVAAAAALKDVAGGQEAQARLAPQTRSQPLLQEGAAEQEQLQEAQGVTPEHEQRCSGVLQQVELLKQQAAAGAVAAALKDSAGGQGAHARLTPQPDSQPLLWEGAAEQEQLQEAQGVTPEHEEHRSGVTQQVELRKQQAAAGAAAATLKDVAGSQGAEAQLAPQPASQPLPWEGAAEQEQLQEPQVVTPEQHITGVLQQVELLKRQAAAIAAGGLIHWAWDKAQGK